MPVSFRLARDLLRPIGDQNALFGHGRGTLSILRGTMLSVLTKMLSLLSIWIAS